MQAVENADYTSEDKDLMIDISREIDENLAGSRPVIKGKEAGKKSS